jgi:hypothetical protein
MRRIDLDFAQPPRPPFVTWIVLAAGAFLLALAADGYADLADEAGRLESQVNRLQRQTSSPQSAKGRTELAARERSELRQRELLASVAGSQWTLPLQAIETALDKDVALVALNQEFAGRHIRLGLEAKSIDDALAFAERLRATGRFDDVVLTNHETKKSTGVDVLGLTLVLTWKAAA